MTECVIYCRISRDPEGRQVGVDRQEQDCRRIAAQHGLTVTQVFIDNDIGASTLSKKKRPQYEQMMALAEAGQIRAVLSYSNSRLTRRPLELERLIAAHDRTGVELRTVVSGRDDLSTADGRMTARIKASVDAAESERIGERVRRAKLETRLAGRWGGGRRPYGYNADGVTVRAYEKLIVADATDAILLGTSLRTYAAKLNAQGCLTSTGRAWAPTELRKVLVRARNAGLREHQGKVIGKAEWPALVAEEKWLAVRSLLADPDRRTTTSSARRWLLSGIAECGVCGAPLRAVTLATTRGGSPAYTCSAHKCVVRSAAQLDAYVSLVTKERLRRPDTRNLLRPAARRVDLAALSAEETNLRTRLDELADNLDLDERTVARRSKKMRERLDEIAQQKTAAGQGSVLGGIVDAPDPGAAWEALDDLDRKRAVIRVLMTITVNTTKKGRRKGWRPGESYFDPESVLIT
jgi:site-specific DNA recombinase